MRLIPIHLKANFLVYVFATAQLVRVRLSPCNLLAPLVPVHGFIRALHQFLQALI